MVLTSKNITHHPVLPRILPGPAVMQKYHRLPGSATDTVNNINHPVTLTSCSCEGGILSVGDNLQPTYSCHFYGLKKPLCGCTGIAAPEQKRRGSCPLSPPAPAFITTALPDGPPGPEGGLSYDVTLTSGISRPVERFRPCRNCCLPPLRPGISHSGPG